MKIQTTLVMGSKIEPAQKKQAIDISQPDAISKDKTTLQAGQHKLLVKQPNSKFIQVSFTLDQPINRKVILSQLQDKITSGEIGAKINVSKEIEISERLTLRTPASDTSSRSEVLEQAQALLIQAQSRQESGPTASSSFGLLRQSSSSSVDSLEREEKLDPDILRPGVISNALQEFSAALSHTSPKELFGELKETGTSPSGTQLSMAESSLILKLLGSDDSSFQPAEFIQNNVMPIVYEDLSQADDPFSEIEVIARHRSQLEQEVLSGNLPLTVLHAYEQQIPNLSEHLEQEAELEPEAIVPQIQASSTSVSNPSAPSVPPTLQPLPELQGMVEKAQQNAELKNLVKAERLTEMLSGILGPADGSAVVSYGSQEWGRLKGSEQKAVMMLCNNPQLLSAEIIVAKRLMEYLPTWEHADITNSAVRGLAPMGRVSGTNIAIPPEKALMTRLQSPKHKNDTGEIERKLYPLHYTDGLGRERTTRVFLSTQERADWLAEAAKNQTSAEPEASFRFGKNPARLRLPEQFSKQVPLDYTGPSQDQTQKWGIEMEGKGFTFSYAQNRLLLMEMNQMGNMPLFKFAHGTALHADISGDNAGIFEMVTPPMEKDQMSRDLTNAKTEYNQFLSELCEIGKQVRTNSLDPQTLADFKTKYQTVLSDSSIKALGTELYKQHGSRSEDKLVAAVMGGNNKLCQVTTSVTNSEYAVSSGSSLKAAVTRQNVTHDKRFYGKEQTAKLGYLMFKSSAEALDSTLAKQSFGENLSGIVQIGRSAYRIQDTQVSYLGAVHSRPEKAAPYGAYTRNGEKLILAEFRERTTVGKYVGETLHEFWTQSADTKSKQAANLVNLKAKLDEKIVQLASQGFKDEPLGK